MSVRSFRRLVLIGCLTVLASGCSFVFVHGPPSGHQDLQDFSCTEGKTLPAIDAIWAGIGGITMVGGLTSDPNSGSGDAFKSIAITAGGASLAVWGFSALMGFDRVDRCRTARSELARRSQEDAERVRLMTKADSTGSTHLR
jgi:hypothetical protein